MELTKNSIPQQPLSLPGNIREPSEIYGESELTEKEISEILKAARKKKFFALAQKEHWDKVNRDPVFPKFTAEELLMISLDKAQKSIPDFETDGFNEKILFDLCLYFTGDKRFEINGKSLAKGICLYGNIGCGKTTFMRLFCDNQISSYRIVSCRKVSGEFTELGNESISNYSGKYQQTGIGIKFGHSEFIGLCFDDLGTEESKKHFGNQSNVMGEILLNRYDKGSFLKNKTHITTNLTVDEIESIYGSRVRSRMREMFNLIAFEAQSPDRRK